VQPPVRADVQRPEDRLKRLLTVGHSYVVAQNRRLAHAMAIEGAGKWEVTVAAPERLQGDLRSIDVEPIPDEASALVALPVWFGGHSHLRVYGRGVRRLLRQQWDVVHCWEEPYVLAAAQIARHVPSGALFVPATFQNIAKHYPAPIAATERRVMRRADAWIAFGETVHETHRDRGGYVSKPSRVINPGVDLAAFRPDPATRRVIRERLGWSADDFVVGFTGRLVEEKGVATLIEAFAQSTRRWNIVFVGGGPMQPHVDTLRLQHPSQVRMVSGVPHDDMPSYLAAMDVLCAPSRTTPRWREQFGRMLIEAMACGVPVIASASGEIPHVVGDAGVLVPEEGEPGAWARAIEDLLLDRTRRADLSTRGLERVRARFGWHTAARAHLDFFEELSHR
jgi:glycosyltransferase involved in cell wall biosynthesis